jgi:hypothetical protein
MDVAVDNNATSSVAYEMRNTVSLRKLGGGAAIHHQVGLDARWLVIGRGWPTLVRLQ